MEQESKTTAGCQIAIEAEQPIDLLRRAGDELRHAVGRKHGEGSRLRSNIRRLGAMEALDSPDPVKLAKLRTLIAECEIAFSLAVAQYEAARANVDMLRAQHPRVKGWWSRGGVEEQAIGTVDAWAAQEESRLAMLMLDLPLPRPTDAPVRRLTEPLPRSVTRARSPGGFASPLLAAFGNPHRRRP